MSIKNCKDRETDEAKRKELVARKFKKKIL
jgi:hypothetical protein